MPIDFEPIEQGFMQTLRALPAFAGWKKRRKRCLWRALADGVEQGVELLRYRDSFENRQLVSLGLYVSVPCEREWPVYVPPDVWDKGRLYRRACLAPGQGLVGEATLGSGAVVELCSPDDLARWLAALPADIERYVGPWFSQYDTLATASYEYEIPRWRLQQAGLLAVAPSAPRGGLAPLYDEITVPWVSCNPQALTAATPVAPFPQRPGVPMIRLHAPSRFLFAVAALLAAAGSHAQGPDRPAVLKALEARGLRVVEEFKVGGDLRAFAGVAGDQPVAIYVTRDGNAIVGARLDAEGKPLDEAKLEALVSKPMGDQAWAQLEKSTWVLDGKKDAPRIIYTFSDANCPYCHKFWEAARPWVDSGKVQLRHVLVGVIRQDSPAKAAAILGAADPSAALLENEHKFNAGGITPAKSVPGNIGKMLDDNQALMVSLGFRGTPGIVVRDDAGAIKKYNGMPQAGKLAEVFGPR